MLIGDFEMINLPEKFGAKARFATLSTAALLSMQLSGCSSEFQNANAQSVSYNQNLLKTSCYYQYL